MEVKIATAADISDIVSLLKTSLGEDLMPKSLKYWTWKHIDNPFGQSPVLLSHHEGRLVGVRAFMKWQWRTESKIYHSVRAVDTATHPSFQGKGIFKNLTLALVKKCVEQGEDFVFNTPNSDSKPGYLKMGWTEAGKVPVRVKIIRPLHIARNFIFRREPNMDSGKASGPYDVRRYLDHPGLQKLIDTFHRQQKDIVSNISIDYLRWRYATVPVVEYLAIGDGDDIELNGLVVGRMKSTRMGTEFRITQLFSRDETTTAKLMKKVFKVGQIDFVTIDGLAGKNCLRGLTVLSMKGPMVTIRPLALANLEILNGFGHWSPTLGDLELF